jgi:hypothetical protein
MHGALGTDSRARASTSEGLIWPEVVAVLAAQQLLTLMAPPPWSGGRSTAARWCWEPLPLHPGSVLEAPWDLYGMGSWRRCLYLRVAGVVRVTAAAVKGVERGITVRQRPKILTILGYCG